MIAGRKTETESSAEKEEAKNDPVLNVRVWKMAFGIRVAEDREPYHPQGSQKMAIYVAGLVMDIKTASKGVNI